MEEGGRKTFIIRASSNVHSRRNERRGGEETHSRADNAKKRFPRFGTVPIGYDRHKSGRPDHVNLLFVSQLSLKSARDTLIPIAAFIPSFSPDFDIHFRGEKSRSISISIRNQSDSFSLLLERIDRIPLTIDRSIDRLRARACKTSRGTV